MSFAKLTPAEHEALAHLMEECAEVCMAIGKAMRHGLSSCHPNGGPTNRAQIGLEVGDLQVAIEIAKQTGLLSESDIRNGADAKWRKIGRYMHHIAIDSMVRSARVKK